MKVNSLVDIFKYIKVPKNSPGSCWNWTGGLRGYGYGAFRIKNKTHQAHRLLYQIMFGEIPENKELHHLCENTKCVKPFHLKPVTHRENVLLGHSMVAENAKKTHCIRGHELIWPNLVKRKSGRTCKACYRIYWHARKDKKMDNELARKSENIMNLEDQIKQAEMFIKSGFFPRHIDTPQKAIVIIQKGKELGLPKTEALSKISVINGQPCTKVETLLGLSRRTGEFQNMAVKQFDDRCEVTITRKGQTPYTTCFGDKEATLMGLIQKDNYKKQKSVMYLWRATSANLRVTFPDAIGGLYIEEEIADDVVLSRDPEPQVEEVVTVVPEQPKIEAKAGNDDQGIQDDQLGNYVLNFGKYKGMRLTQIVGQVTDNGKNVGLEYLEWLSDQVPKNEPAKKAKDVVSRFLTIFQQIQ